MFTTLTFFLKMGQTETLGAQLSEMMVTKHYEHKNVIIKIKTKG